MKLYKEQSISIEVIEQKDFIINRLMKDMKALQEWLTGFCEGKMMDLQSLCTNNCTINSIGSILQKANGNSVCTTNDYSQLSFYMLRS